MMLHGHSNMRNYAIFSQALYCVLIFLSLLFSTLGISSGKIGSSATLHF